MERIELLINRLKQQFEQNADPAILSGTVQLLQFELAKLKSSDAKSLGTAKVAVMLPSVGNRMAETGEVEYQKYAPRPVDTISPTREMKETYLIEEDAVSQVQKNGQLDMVFDPMTEIPTLSHQPKAKEINDNSGQAESLNDKLRVGKAELMEVLKDSPVKDLRKAIGINDRFVFINELFRGDEPMYERSIKTINSFNIYPEAEYWISRELKLKLGWNVSSDIVKHFDQLVRRRFS